MNTAAPNLNAGLAHLPYSPYRAKLIAKGEKTCKGCGGTLPLGLFLVNKDFGPYCASCRAKPNVRRCKHCGEVLAIKGVQVCSACREASLQRRCPQCGAALLHKWARRCTDCANITKVEARHRQKCRMIVRVARRNGTLPKPPFCQGCGELTQKLECHHQDYSKPREVQWLCVSCHGKADAKVRRDAKAQKAQVAGMTTSANNQAELAPSLNAALSGVVIALRPAVERLSGRRKKSGLLREKSAPGMA